jgi:hypothetical protein
MSPPGSFPLPNTTHGVLKTSSNSPVYDTLPGFAKNLGGGVFGGGSNFLASLFFLASFFSSLSDNLFVSILTSYFLPVAAAADAVVSSDFSSTASSVSLEAVSFVAASVS